MKSVRSVTKTTNKVLMIVLQAEFNLALSIASRLSFYIIIIKINFSLFLTFYQFVYFCNSLFIIIYNLYIITALFNLKLDATKSYNFLISLQLFSISKTISNNVLIMESNFLFLNSDCFII